MKRIIILIITALLCGNFQYSFSEGLLPELEELYGVAMPSLFNTLNRAPNEQNTLEDNSIQEIWYNVTDSEYAEFGEYLSSVGCLMLSYAVEGSIFSAEVAKEGHSFFFSYDAAEKRATLIYPSGVYDGKLDISEKKYQQALIMYQQGDIHSARYAFMQAGKEYKDSSTYLSATEPISDMLVVGGMINGIRADGTTLAENNFRYTFCDKEEIQKWDDILKITSGYTCIAGLKRDGTVVATGINDNGACNVSEWTNIVDVCGASSGYSYTDSGNFDSTNPPKNEKEWKRFQLKTDAFTVGLMSTGRVIATGYNDHSQCDVDQWIDIIEISCTSTRNEALTAGLKYDGTVVCTLKSITSAIKKLNNVISIVTGATAEGYAYVAGIKEDKTVVVIGRGCHKLFDVSDWSDIVLLRGINNHLLGLKSDGTVSATGSNTNGQCNVSDWNDIVDITSGYNHSVGLKKDGTVVATGDNTYGQCEVKNWTGIVAIKAFADQTFGIKADGSIIMTGTRNEIGGILNDWRLWNSDSIDSTDNNATGAKADSFISLQKGSKGKEVIRLQEALIKTGKLSGPADGSFGRLTEEAVKKLQIEYGMEATGIADEEFQEKLYDE